MAHGFTGKDGTVSFGGSGLVGKLTGWDVEFDADWKNDTGNGEGWDSMVHLRDRWVVNAKGWVVDASERGVLGTGELSSGVFGRTGTVACKQKTGDTNPLFTTTGGVKNLKIDVPGDDVVAFTCQFICTEGVAPTLDTSP